MLLDVMFLRLKCIVIVVFVVLMKMIVDWRGVNIKIDIWVCCVVVSEGVLWFDIDIVMLNKWRFCCFRFVVVVMVLVLLKRNKYVNSVLFIDCFFNYLSVIEL